MPLAVFDVTKNYAKIGELFDTSKKYVYKDPNSGEYAVPVRTPSSGYFYSGSYYWQQYESWNGSVTNTVYWLGDVATAAGYAEVFNAPGSGYIYYRGSVQTSSTNFDTPNGEPEVTTNYSVARATFLNPNVIRMPHLWTMYNTGSSLTYSFDGEGFTVGPAPPSLPSTSPSPRLFFLGVI
jgi:hypothetical protein